MTRRLLAALLPLVLAAPASAQLDHGPDTGVLAFHGVLTPICDGTCPTTYQATFTGIGDATFALPPAHLVTGPMTAELTVTRQADACAAVTSATGTFTIVETGEPYDATLNGSLEWTRLGAAGAVTAPTLYGYPLRSGLGAGTVTFVAAGGGDVCDPAASVAVTATLAVVGII